MPVESTHSDYDANLPVWLRARDVIAGEDAVKSGGERYLTRLESQTEDEFNAYKNRASFFNATARTVDGYVGLIFRREPTFKLPEDRSGVGRAFAEFIQDADMLGTSLSAYAKNVVTEVVGVGRAGTLVDWEGEVEQHAYAVLYRAEQIRNWRTERVNGRNVLTLVVLDEMGHCDACTDTFVAKPVEQLRVLRLMASAQTSPNTPASWSYQVEIWRLDENKAKRKKSEWVLVETRIPLRLGKPLPLIPFVFHGPRHSLTPVEKLPLSDIIAVNLDHYRLNADYKHGLHFTALPTAWVSGFDKSASLRIGSTTAWVSETPGATAGFLEFTGSGLSTFEHAMDRDERLMAVLGTRMLESSKRVGESADAIELRQGGESSVLSAVSVSVSDSLTAVLRWVYWWNSTEATPDSLRSANGEVEPVLATLNSDFGLKGMVGRELTAVVAAWQSGAMSRETMFDLFRKGELLTAGRTNEEEAKLIASEAEVTP